MTTPYVLIKASKNGGAATSGAITVANLDTIDLSLASTYGLSTFKWEIFSHPKNDSPLGSDYNTPCPSGWSVAADGYTYVYEGSATPPQITIPASTWWGKILIRCTANGDDTLVDDSMMLRLDSTNGLEDAAPFETTQADATRQWARAQQKALRLLDEVITASGGGPGTAPGPQLPAADANHLIVFDLTNAAGTTTISNAGAGTAFDLTATGAGTATFGVPTPVGDGLHMNGVKYFSNSSGAALTYQPSSTVFTAEALVRFHALDGSAVSITGGSAGDKAFLFGKANGASDATFAMWITLDGGRVLTKIKTATTGVASYTAGYITVGEQHHVAMVYDGSTIKTYLNGIEIDSRAQTGAPSWDDTKSFIVGNFSNGSNLALTGVRFSNTARSAAYMKSTFKSIRGWR